MTWLDALILGIIEGLTEYLPVSSTGHLILANTLLGLEGDAVDAYIIVIQLGAILAVLALYRQRALEMIQGLLGRNPAGLQLLLKLLVAFLPAAALGLALEELIEALLFRPLPVAAALIVGGVAMIVVERVCVKNRPGGHAGRSVEELGYADALIIGFAQCLSLWPGTSRSMSTIIGSQLRGFSSTAAAEISFLLALPTLGGATVYKLLKEHETLLQMENGTFLIIFGNVIAFVVAVLAVKMMVGIVRKHGMAPFGYYRIVIGLIFLVLSLAGFLDFDPETPIDGTASPE